MRLTLLAKLIIALAQAVIVYVQIKRREPLLVIPMLLLVILIIAYS